MQLRGGTRVSISRSASGYKTMQVTEKEVYDELDALKSALDAFVQLNVQSPQDRKRAKLLLSWFREKLALIQAEPTFVLTDSQKKLLKRGAVCWISFGFNVGTEFGGKHPAVILRVGTKYGEPAHVWVIPLSTKVPTEDKATYVKVPPNAIRPITGFYPPIERSANVLNLTKVSVMRIDFNSPVGAMDTSVMEEIKQKLEQWGTK